MPTLTPKTKAVVFRDRIKTFTQEKGEWIKLHDLPEFTIHLMLRDIKKELHPQLKNNEIELVELYGLLLFKKRDYEAALPYFEFVHSKLQAEHTFHNLIQTLVSCNKVDELIEILKGNQGKAENIQHWFTTLWSVYISFAEEDKPIVIDVFQPEIFQKQDIVLDFSQLIQESLEDKKNSIPWYMETMEDALDELEDIDFSKKPPSETIRLFFEIFSTAKVVNKRDEHEFVDKLNQIGEQFWDYFGGIEVDTLPPEILEASKEAKERLRDV